MHIRLPSVHVKNQSIVRSGRKRRWISCCPSVNFKLEKRPEEKKINNAILIACVILAGVRDSRSEVRISCGLLQETGGSGYGCICVHRTWSITKKTKLIYYKSYVFVEMTGRIVWLQRLPLTKAVGRVDILRTITNHLMNSEKAFVKTTHWRLLEMETDY